MLTFRMKSLFFYALPLIFIWLVMFTHFGDMRRGATVMEWLGLQGFALAILLGVWMMLHQVNAVEKAVLVLCAIMPTVSLVHAVLSLVIR